MRHPFASNVLITGVTSGIGKACAQAFLADGYHVYGVARRPSDDLPGVHFTALDVTDTIAVKETVKRIDQAAVKETGSHISLLVSCAGMGISGSAECSDMDLVKKQFEVNYFGTLNVVQAALPFLRLSNPSLVILLSSVAGRVTVPFQSHYASTKFAIEAYGEALRMEARPYGVHVSLVEPGDTKTGFTKARVVAEPEDSPYLKEVTRATAQFGHDEQTGYPVEAVVKVVMGIASHRHTPVRRAVGFLSKAEVLLIKLLPACQAEAILRRIYCK